jgi:hypothetical protein
VIQEQHGASCNEPAWLEGFGQPLPFRVIDVNGRCVTEAPLGCRYFALSYVWGTSTTFRCTTENFDTLREQNSFNKFSIPNTIQDAMTLISSIGESYLWVDAVCIIQDDESDKAEQIAQMELIYSGAIAAIIAAGGDNSSSGIPGIVNRERDIYQEPVQVGNDLYLKKLLETGTGGHVKHTTWSTRAWTFQERLFSRRAIIFTRDQSYWDCSKATYCEEVKLELMPTEESRNVIIEGSDEQSEQGESRFSIKNLGSYISQYSSRHLTFQEDALSAISGIISRMSFLESVEFHWGLPRLYFGGALCWHGTSSRRKGTCAILTKSKSIRHVPFPSWSWLGWLGHVSLEQTYVDPPDAALKPHWRGEIYPEISFYKLGEDGSTQEIVAQQDLGTRPCNTRYDVTKSLSGDRFDDLRRQWIGPRTVANRVLVRTLQDKTSSDRTQPSEVSRNIDMITKVFEDTGRLVFWTSYSRITRSTAPESLSNPKVFKIETLQNPNFGRDNILRGEEVKDFPNGAVLDLIVVSREYQHGLTTRASFCQLNLLIIEWSESEENVARRIGCYRIIEEDWIKAERTWRLVVLE